MVKVMCQQELGSIHIAQVSVSVSFVSLAKGLLLGQCVPGQPYLEPLRVECSVWR